MTIGTSLGQVFKSVFQQQAGVPDNAPETEVNSPTASSLISQARRSNTNTSGVSAHDNPEVQSTPLTRTGIGPDYHLQVPPDQMTDHEFLRWGEYQPENSMTPTQEERWHHLALDERDRLDNLIPPDVGNQSSDDLQRQFEEEDRRYTNNVSSIIKRSPSFAKKGSLDLKQLAPPTPYGRYKFGLVSDDGQLGEMNASLRNGGKTFYVDWIGSLGHARQFDFGTKNIRDLANIVKDKFPDVEEIAGFRISGARAETGKGPDVARMRIRPAKPQPVGKSIQQLWDEWNDAFPEESLTSGGDNAEERLEQNPSGFHPLNIVPDMLNNNEE